MKDKKTNNNILMFQMETDKPFGTIIVISVMIMKVRNIVFHETVCLEGKIALSRLSGNVNINNIKKVKSNKELRDWFRDMIRKNKDCEIWTDFDFPTQSRFIDKVKQEDLDDRMDYILDHMLNTSKNNDNFNNYKYEKLEDRMAYILSNLKCVLFTCPVESLGDDIKLFHKELSEVNPEFSGNEIVYGLKFCNPLHVCLLNLHILARCRNIDSRPIIDYYIEKQLFI